MLQGKGIYLTDRVERLAEADNMVAQKYIRHPLLIGTKTHTCSHTLIFSRNETRRILRGQQHTLSHSTQVHPTPTASSVGRR